MLSFSKEEMVGIGKLVSIWEQKHEDEHAQTRAWTRACSKSIIETLEKRVKHVQN